MIFLKAGGFWLNDKNDGGYGAYMHLIAKNLGEAVLAAKATQLECRALKGFRIKFYEKLVS